MSGVKVGYRFAMIPEWVLYHPDLTPLAVRVYGCLARHGMDPDSCYPGHDRIARLVGCDPRTVARPIRQLIEVGAIQTRKRNPHGVRRSNGYWLAGDEPFTEANRAVVRGTPQSQPRNPARPNRAPERAEGEPPNETSTYISTDTQDACTTRTPELLRRAQEKASAMAARRAANQEGTPTP